MDLKLLLVAILQDDLRVSLNQYKNFKLFFLKKKKSATNLSLTGYIHIIPCLNSNLYVILQ